MRGRSWGFRWKAVACLVPVLAAGCQTARPDGRESVSNNMLNPFGGDASASADPNAASATAFRAAVTPNQEYNVHMDLGRLHDRDGNNEAAVAEYAKAIAVTEKPVKRHGEAAIGPAEKSLSHRRVANALDRMGRFAEAEAHYRLALEANPNDPSVWNDVGYSYYLQNRWSDAERSLKTAARLAPTDAKIQTNLGLALAAAGKSDEALQTMSAATGPGAAHANLGYVMAATGQLDAARAQYQAALQAQPQLAAAQVALTKIDSQAQALARAQAANAAVAQATARPAADPSVGPAAVEVDQDLYRASSSTGIAMPNAVNSPPQSN